MQTLTLTLGANQTVAFDISGSYFEIIDSVGLISVNFYDASGSRTKDLELLRVLSGFYVKGRFSRFEVAEVSGSAQTITVLYGSTEGGSRRSPGVVQVVDSDKTTSLADQAFIAKGTAPATASQFPYHQLFNPANSGVVCILEKVTLSVTAPQNVVMARETVQSALSGGSFSESKNWTVAQPALSKSLRISGSTATFAAPGTNVQFVMGTGVFSFQPKRPIVIRPGVGVGFWGDLANSALVVDYEFTEQPL